MRWGATSKVRCRGFAATGDASVNLHPSGAETDSFGYDSEATPPEALPDDASPCPVQVGGCPGLSSVYGFHREQPLVPRS